MRVNGLHTSSALAEADAATRAGEFSVAARLLTEIAGPGSDFSIWLRLAVVGRRSGDYTGALDALTSALALKPDELSAVLMKGSILRAFGRREEAARAYAHALAVAPPSHTLPPPIRAELDKAQAAVTEDALWRARLANINLAGASQARLEKLRADILAGGEGPLRLDGLPHVGFYDPADFPGVAEFAAATPQILAEFQTLVAQRVPELVTAHGSGGGLGAEQSRKWSAIHLISDGKVVEDNARFAPLTLELYERLGPPKIAGRSPNLMFSLLDPKTSIPPHHGIINTRLVLHIPLIVPNDCALRVGDETRTWEPGTAMIFDDTIEHEAWNDSDALRVVLLGDVWRPELDAGEQAAIARLMARE